MRKLLSVLASITLIFSFSYNCVHRGEAIIFEEHVNESGEREAIFFQPSEESTKDEIKLKPKCILRFGKAEKTDNNEKKSESVFKPIKNWFANLWCSEPELIKNC